MSWLIFGAAVALALGRAFITPRLGSVPSLEGAYETAAHIFVGLMLAAAVYDRRRRRLAIGLLIALSLWELGWFLAQKFL